VTASNSILWGNSLDVTGAVMVAWSDVRVVAPAVTTNNCISFDPFFASVAADGYHLKSRGGRWDPAAGEWVVDSITWMSPCIDAGDPADLGWLNEPRPNGQRLNLGAYGGTWQASKSWRRGTMIRTY
jgi:hypothetical protein